MCEDVIWLLLGSAVLYCVITGSNRWVYALLCPRNMEVDDVDSHFKVYGTKNLRIVDGSVLPIQLSAHLSSTLYGLSEKASEDIGKTAHQRH